MIGSMDFPMYESCQVYELRVARPDRNSVRRESETLGRLTRSQLGRRLMLDEVEIDVDYRLMTQLTRRDFVKASGALAAAAPAFNVLSLQAQGPAPDTGNLRVEKDIVFGKGGTKDLTLDVYRPPAGGVSKRMAIVHLFGGGFF